MRLTPLVLGTLFATASPGLAQDFVPADSHERAAYELTLLLELEDITAQSIAMMTENMVSQNPMFAQFSDIFTDFFQEHMQWRELLPGYVAIYKEAYTEPELRELAAFYRTPLGRKTVELMPRLMVEGAEMAQRQIEPHLPELQRRIEARMMGGGVRD